MNHLLIQIHDAKFGDDRSYRSSKRKRERRSFKETAGVGGCWYFGRQQIGPENLQFLDNLKKIFSFLIVEKQTFHGAFFAIARHRNKSCQVKQDLILAFMKELLFYSHELYYLDCIDAPATSTIYQVCLAIRFSKNYVKLFFSSASMKRVLLNCISAQGGIVGK